MIRIRKSDGSAADVESALAVELCTPDGRLAALVFEDGGRVSYYDTSDPELATYAAGLKLEMAKVINLEKS